MSTLDWTLIVGVPVAAVWVVPIVWRWRAVTKREIEGRRDTVFAAVNARGGSESGLLELMTTYPNEALPAVRWAERKFEEQDLEEALKRAEAVSKKFPKDVLAYFFQIKVLKKLGRQEEAKILARKGISLCSASPTPLLETGEIALAEENWTDLCTICDTISRKFPDLGQAYLWKAVALTKLGDLSAADITLSNGLAVAKPVFRRALLIHYAQAAHNREDWLEAARRWTSMREIIDTESISYWCGAEALRRAGGKDLAENLLKSASIIFPHDPDVLREISLCSSQNIQ